MTATKEGKEGQQHDRTALVLYGSETGNSQDVAEDLGRLAQRLHFWTKVCEMDQVDLRSLPVPTIVIFAVGTTGQGEFPRNARKLWKSLLRKRLPPGCLAHVNFTTFGLGDSSYTKYNWAARKLHKRIEQLGAKEVYPRGEADERHEDGIDGTFLSWSADLRKHLLSSYPLPPGVTEIPADELLPPTHTLELRPGAEKNHLATYNNVHSEAVNLSNNKTPSLDLQQTNSTLSTSTTIDLETSNYPPNMRTNWAPEPEYEVETRWELKEEAGDLASAHDESDRFPPKHMLPIAHAFKARLVKNERVTPESHWQDVRLLTFNIPAKKDYYAGDCLTIFPKNFPKDVQALIDLQGWNDVADMPLVFKAQAPDFFGADNLVSLNPGTNAFKDSTLRELLIHSLDFTAIPKRHFFQMISHHTDDLRHRERLLDFTNPMFTDEFYDYASRPRRSMLEVLQEFSTVKLPWKWATTFFPPIRGRQFSICSGGLQKESSGFDNKITVQLLVAIVKYKTVLRKVRQGLCSRYIADLPVGTGIAVTMAPNETFSKAVEENFGLPVIMVGPGTGVAPCRSLIWQRATDAIDYPDHARDMLLFFGNRNKNADYFFQPEWNIPTLRTDIFTAFSRDQKEKIYVQDLIRKEGSRVHKLLKENALIIVCGSSGKMPQQVRHAFIDVLEEYGGPWESREKVEEAFALIEKDGRYLQETW